MHHPMQQLIAFIVLVSVLAFPSAAIAGENDPPGLMRSGIAAVARMSNLRPDSPVAAQPQPSQVNNNKKTTIILVTVAAAAIVALILIPYEKSHAHGGVTITGLHF
jgi:hypothetical protein